MLKTKSLKPFLKWAGGKSRIADKLNKLYDPHRYRRLVEPFCGGLGVALSLMPDRALLNDINKDLIGLYRSISGHQFEALDIPNSGVSYYMIRDRFNEERLVTHQKCQDFYYLNTAGYNGLCRYNQDGGFNVPYGKRKKLSTIKDFSYYAKTLEDWHFRQGDYRDMISNHDDFIICDSPYDSLNDAGFTAYSGNTFNWQEQIELANWLDRQPRIPQIACNAATDRIIQLYTDRGWDIEIVDMHTSISCDGNRTPRKEMFATRNL
jgi:DNA adenine methylase